MATLTSADLRCRVVLQPRDYQFRTADNIYDLNWVIVMGRLVGRGSPGRVIRTRLATWELTSIVNHLEQMANGERTLWQPRFFDSGLHLWLRRSTERPDLIVATVVLAPVTGPPPHDLLANWRDDRLTYPGGMEGLRFTCTRGALAIFSEELRTIVAAFPTRSLQPPDGQATPAKGHP